MLKIFPIPIFYSILSNRFNRPLKLMFLNVDFMGPFKENGYILYTLFIHIQAYLGGKKYMNGLLAFYGKILRLCLDIY